MFPLILIGIWSAVLLLKSCPHYYYAGYWFTLPFILLAGACFLLAVIGLFTPSKRKSIFWVIAPVHGAMLIPYGFAMLLWPGGDDGGGLNWLWFVGAASVVALLLSLILMIVVWWIQKKKKEPNQQSPEPTRGAHL
jgi:hypothetical protein